MSAQPSRAAVKSAVAKSGAAGSAVFPGSDSRKYNYFEPKGRKATHYEDMTVDVQPDPERYLLQDWIISFPDGTPTYSKDWTAAKSCSNSCCIPSKHGHSATASRWFSCPARSWSIIRCG